MAKLTVEIETKRGETLRTWSFVTQDDISSSENTFNTVSDIVKCTENGTEKEVSINLSLDRFKLQKQVYSPNVLDFTLCVESCVESKGMTTIEIYRTAINSVKGWLKGRQVAIKHGEFSIASKYIIEKMEVKGEAKQRIPNEESDAYPSFTLYCTAYSPDYFLTLDKFCNVFTMQDFQYVVCCTLGQKLKKKTDTDGKVVTVKENTSEYECYEDFTKPCDMYKFQNELNIQIADLGTLLVTSTTDSTKKRIDNTKKDNGYFEHITNTTIPYLVQYNESFYNFLRRVCYRSGEYLFYEKGAFYIGRGKLGEKSKNIEYKTEDETGLMGNAEVANPSGLTNNHFIEVKSWDYRKIKYELDKGEKDCFKDGINVDEGNLLDKYNDEMSTKEFEKNEEATSSAYNKMDSFNDNFNRILRAQTFALANTGISSYHFLQGIMALSMRIVVSATVYGTMWEGKDLEGTYTKIWNINDTNSWKESGTDFYNTIQKNILEAHKGALNLKFTNKIEDVYVGQEVKLTRDLLGMGKQYIVNEVSLTFENKTFGYGLRVVPAENKVPDLHEEIPLTVTSGPQAAVVTNSLDPENMGRVRVRYFWQKLNELKSGSSTSPLMRVTSPMKTGSRGFSFVPSEGDFVMVDYEYGNMEKPYIIGALPNNAINSECNTGDRWETKNGWMWNNDRDGGLHLSSSISSINGHTIKFNDPKKSAALGMSPMGPMLNAALGLVECNKATSNGWPAGGITMSDTLGTYSIDMSADKREISISSPMGEVKINSLLGISIEAPKGDISIRGMNINIEAGNNLTISSANAFKKGLRKRSGKSVADYANFGLPILAPIAKMAFDFDFLRKLLQVFWCPIQGTIELYTPGNILLNQCQRGGVNFSSTHSSTHIVRAYVSNVVNAVNGMTERLLKESNTIKDKVCTTYENLTQLAGYIGVENNTNGKFLKEVPTILTTDGVVVGDDGNTSVFDPNHGFQLKDDVFKWLKALAKIKSDRLPNEQVRPKRVFLGDIGLDEGEANVIFATKENNADYIANDAAKKATVTHANKLAKAILIKLNSEAEIGQAEVAAYGIGTLDEFKNKVIGSNNAADQVVTFGQADAGISGNEMLEHILISLNDPFPTQMGNVQIRQGDRVALGNHQMYISQVPAGTLEMKGGPGTYKGNYKNAILKWEQDGAKVLGNVPLGNFYYAKKLASKMLIAMHRSDIWDNFNDETFIGEAKYFFANPVANQALEDGWGNLSARKVIVNNWSEFIAYAGNLPANNGEKEDSTAVTNAMKTFGLDKWRGWAKEGNIAYGLLGGTWESDSKAKYKQGIYIHTEDNKTVKISNGKVEEHNDCKSVLEGLKY